MTVSTGKLAPAKNNAERNITEQKNPLALDIPKN